MAENIINGIINDNNKRRNNNEIKHCNKQATIFSIT